MPQVDIENIMQELMNMHKTLCSENAKSSSAFILARVMPQMDKKAWERLCAKAPGMGWCALEINGDIPSIQAPVQALSNINLDDELSDSLLDAAFMQYLEVEVTRCVRTNAPLTLVHFEQVSDEKKSLKDTTYILQKAVHKYGGLCDVVGPIGKGRLALILPGAKTFKAQNVVEDIVNLCAQEELLLKAGISGSLSKDGASDLIEQANSALADAFKHSQTVRVYQKTAIDMDATLVQSHEKRFLFGGG